LDHYVCISNLVSENRCFGGTVGSAVITQRLVTVKCDSLVYQCRRINFKPVPALSIFFNPGTEENLRLRQERKGFAAEYLASSW